jgi:hypothetical protein
MSAASGRAQTGRIEKHLAAMVAAQHWKISPRRSIGTITISLATGELSGPCEIDVKAPNNFRAYMQLDLSAMGVPDKMVVEQKFDGTSGWALNSMQGDTEITGGQLQNMRNNAFPSMFLNYKNAGLKVEVLPNERAGGRDYLVLVATPKEGPAIRMSFDAETYLLARTVTKYFSAPMGMDVEQTAELSDYRDVSGVKVPFRVVNSNAQQTGTIVLTKVEHNVPLDDALFKAKAPRPYANEERSEPPPLPARMLGLFLSLGALFGLLAAARRTVLPRIPPAHARPDRTPRRWRSKRPS